MSQAFECPNCGAPLAYPGSDSAAVRCPYCASTIIVPASLRQIQPEGSFVPASTRLDLSGMEELLQEINELITSGKKTEAIKLYKDRFGVGLKEAREAVERIERGEPVLLAEVSVSHAGQLAFSLPEIEEKLRQLLDSGQKIEAIKFYRDVFRAGLSQSKDAVEVFENGEDLPVPIGWREAGEPAKQDPDRFLAEVAFLAQQGNRLAAIQTYREKFDTSLQEAERVVARLAQDSETDPAWIVSQVRAEIVSSRINRAPETEGKSRLSSCLYAGLSIAVIGSFLFGLLAGVVQAFSPLRQTWQRINPLAFARPVASFGGKGSGAGLFSDPRSIAVGVDGSIFVGNFEDGRIQRFDSDGNFLNQWFIQGDSYLGNLAVDRTGQIFATYGGEILRFDGESGRALGPLANPDDNFYDYAVLTPDGGLLAVSSGEDLVRLDSAGRVVWMADEAISSVSGESELDTRLAVDGSGYIYALGTFNSSVFRFSPAGRYLNRWGSRGEQDGQFSAPSAIAVDRYGRVFVSDFSGIQVFDGQDGRFLERFTVPGVVFSMAFDEQNDLYAISNDHLVYHYRLKEPQPMVNRLIHPKTNGFWIGKPVSKPMIRLGYN